MDIHLLGTAGYHPNEKRHTACYMIPAAGIILDAGTGFFRVRDLIETSELHIFLSHCHLDHCFGLSFYIDVLHEKRVRDVFVYGEPAKLDAIRQHLFARDLFPLAPDFHWTPIGDQPVDVPLGGRLTPFPLVHPGGSLGFRIDWPDQSVAYITDTTAGPEAPYNRRIAGVDLLMHECHFPDGYEEMAILTGHSCLTPVAETSRAAAVGRTVIIHLNPLVTADPPLDLSTVEAVFDRMSIGADGMVVSIERPPSGSAPDNWGRNR